MNDVGEECPPNQLFESLFQLESVHSPTACANLEIDNGSERQLLTTFVDADADGSGARI